MADDVSACIQKCVQSTLLLQRALRNSSSHNSPDSSNTTAQFVLTAVNATARQVLAAASTMLASVEPPSSSSASSSNNNNDTKEDRIATATSASSLPKKRVVPMVLYVELHGARRELSDALRRSSDLEQSLLDTKRFASRALLSTPSGVDDEGLENNNNSGAAAREELESLLRTRAMLSSESLKMNDVLTNIEEGSQALEALHRSLEGVQSTLSRTNRIVGALVKVKKLEDVVLRLSWVVFVAAFVWVLGQRLFAWGGPTVISH